MITFKIKDLFFDRASVIGAVDKATRKALSRIGAFIRTRARSSLKKRKASAEPGSAPSVHEGGLRRLLFFGYDQTTKSVVVGPAPYRKGVAPNLLEFGGDISGGGKVIYVNRPPGRDEKGKFVSAGKKKIVMNGTIHYRAFPFMAPALRKELAAGTIPPQWANSIKGK